MKIHRKITRRMTVTAQEVYDALAAKHDFPPCANVFFETPDGMQPSEMELVAIDNGEQEL